MSIFEYTSEELLGTVESVDTSIVIVKVDDDDKMPTSKSFGFYPKL